MKMNVTITGIVPIYNVEKYLTQCLESIVGQSVSFDEVILINDGSTDRSQSICEKYISRYRYFKLINQENRGLSAARNVGLDCAIGEYVLFLDSDDYLKTDTVEKLKDELKKFKLDAIYFDADIHCEKGYEDRENNYVRDMKDLAGLRMRGDYFFLKCYPVNYMVPVWLAVYRKKVIDSTGVRFPEGLYYEDNYFTFAFMMQAKNVTYMPEKLYQRRYRENSIITSTYSEKKFTDYIKIVMMVWEVANGQKDITLPENKIYLKYIGDYCALGLKHRSLCVENNIILQASTKNEFCKMVKTYEDLVRQYCFRKKIEYLPTLNSTLKNLKEINLYCPEYKIYTQKLIKKLSRMQKELYKKLLCGLPFNVEGCKVGIYGTGKHTEGLILLYEELIGKIVCNLFFIDSYKESGSYFGRNIIHYQGIDSSIDIIIISSFIYEQKMVENVRNINKEVPIYVFYNTLNEDVFSEWSLAER